MKESAALQGSFANPAHASAYAFRAAMEAMEAMARPGRIEAITGALAPKPMSVAAGTLLLTLCDTGTPLYLAGALDTPEIRDWVRFISARRWLARRIVPLLWASGGR